MTEPVHDAVRHAVAEATRAAVTPPFAGVERRARARRTRRVVATVAVAAAVALVAVAAGTLPRTHRPTPAGEPRLKPYALLREDPAAMRAYEECLRFADLTFAGGRPAAEKCGARVGYGPAPDPEEESRCPATRTPVTIGAGSAGAHTWRWGLYPGLYNSVVCEVTTIDGRASGISELRLDFPDVQALGTSGSFVWVLLRGQEDAHVARVRLGLGGRTVDVAPRRVPGIGDVRFWATAVRLPLGTLRYTERRYDAAGRFVSTNVPQYVEIAPPDRPGR
jgi:hypothetical protein